MNIQVSELIIKYMERLGIEAIFGKGREEILEKCLSRQRVATPLKNLATMHNGCWFRYA